MADVGKTADPSGVDARTTLPIPDREHIGLTTYDAKDPETAYPPIEPLRPPAGAPNVLVILLDDVGFGASSAFGGPCRTPTAERLAADGLKFNPYDGVVRADAGRIADWPQPSPSGDGHDHRAR